MTRVLRFHEHGLITDKLRMEQIPDRQPVRDEVLIQVDAFALNRADIMFVDGYYTTEAYLPSRIGSEVSGTVLAVGPDVKIVRAGDRVGTIPYPGNNEYGLDGDTALVQDYVVTPEPAGLSPVEASAVWMQYMTAYFAFCDKVRFAAGDSVFFSAASGSAGLGGIQLARMLGVTTIAATRTREKRDFLLQAGADHVIVSSEEDVAARIMEITHGEGVTVAYDPVSGDYIKQYGPAMRNHGIIISYGLLAPNQVLPVVDFWRRATTVYFYSMYNHVMDPVQLARGKAMIYGGLATGQLRPIIDSVFPFDRYLDAYRHMLGNTQRGKIVVQVRQP